MLDVPPEFQGKLIGLPKRPTVPEAVAALEAFANDLSSELGDTPQLYQVNRARLSLADRHELLRRATPARSRGKLDETFNRFYAEMFDRFLKLSTPDLSPPPPPVAQPSPDPKPRPKSVAEALASALYEAES
jgi:hypothetical protein